MFSEFDLLIVAWCSFALLCGGLIKGALGVGTPLLTVPLMALVLPAQTAVAVMALPVVVANLWQASQASRFTAVAARFWPTFIAILIGTYLGVTILSSIDERSLLLFVGIVVIVFTVMQASTYRFHIWPRLEKPSGVVFGLSSGVVGGLSSMFGPMLIIYLVSLRTLNKNEFVSAISFLYVAAVVPWTVMLYAFGILDARMLVLSAAATVPVTLGLIIGQRLRARISEQRFHRLVLVVLLASGGAMSWRAFVLGLILGKIGEQTFAQAMQMLHFEWSGFFNRPIALTLLIAGVLTILGSIYGAFFKQQDHIPTDS